ncbi:MAG: helix-turn-helix transcriptional regulator [Oscillospiraceae bacterium]|nr:helix-turn-helix transcriptional regulator [Oscillospiraceae bacterium]
MNIGDVILNLLEERSMSQRELAARLKIAPTTLNGYIRNKHEPDCTTLVRIAAVFNISVDDLLSYTPETTSEDKRMMTAFHHLRKDQQEIITALIELMRRQNRAEST